MHNNSIRVPDQEAGAGSKGGEFIGEVVEEDFFKGITTEFGEGINLCHEILMLELIFSVPLYSVVETFRNWQEINELH